MNTRDSGSNNIVTTLRSSEKSNTLMQPLSASQFLLHAAKLYD